MRQLNAAFGKGHGLQHRFSNVAVLDLHLACHCLLAEMGSARDYLAMVIAHHASAPPRIDDMKRLRDWRPSRKVSLPDAVLAALDENSSDPWLDDLAGYRNAFVHRSPVSTIESARRLRLREHETPHGPLRTVTLQVPIRLRRDEPPSAELVDALERFYGLARQLSRFALEVTAIAPHKPSIDTLTEANIIDLEPREVVDIKS